MKPIEIVESLCHIRDFLDRFEHEESDFLYNLLLEGVRYGSLALAGLAASPDTRSSLKELTNLCISFRRRIGELSRISFFPAASSVCFGYVLNPFLNTYTFSILYCTFLVFILS